MVYPVPVMGPAKELMSHTWLARIGAGGGTIGVSDRGPVVLEHWAA